MAQTSMIISSSTVTCCSVSVATYAPATRVYADVWGGAVNHSCYPNVAFDVSEPASDSDYPSRWHLKSLSRPIRAGEPLTFFYPSTEWDMSQGFACACGQGEGRCLGWIRGAKDLPRDVLERQEWINPHVWELKKRQQQQQQER